MISAILYVLLVLAAFFWLVQVIDVLVRHPAHFESHTHKLTWFLVVFLSHIVGAAWCFFWRREAVKEHDRRAEAVKQQ